MGTLFHSAQASKAGFLVALCSLASAASPARAATRNILVTGFWHPSNAIVQQFNNEPNLNPQGWKGEDWQGAGYDIYSYFPTFSGKKDLVGSGSFEIDYAAIYNDFFKATNDLSPVAIVSFGEEFEASWVVETTFPAYFQDDFTGTIPSQIGVIATYPVPDSLKTNTTLYATLPAQEIANAVTALGIATTVNTTDDAGNAPCGFMGYLGAWYHSQHADPKDPAYNAMTGFIHTDISVDAGIRAVEATLQQVILKLGKPE